jgi:hypothetical protein
VAVEAVYERIHRGVACLDSLGKMGEIMIYLRGTFDFTGMGVHVRIITAYGTHETSGAGKKYRPFRRGIVIIFFGIPGNAVLPAVQILLYRIEGNVVVPEAAGVEFPLFGVTGAYGRNFVVFIFGIIPPDHLHNMHHGTIRRGQIGDKFRPVHLNEGNYGGTRLGYNGTGFFLFHIIDIGLYGQFRPKADIENPFDPQGLEETVKIEVLPVETGSGCGGHNGDDADPFPEVRHKGVKIIQADTGLVGTGADTFSTADTKLAVVVHNISRPVITHFGRTNHDTPVTVNAFVFHYADNRPQILYFHLNFFLIGRGSPKPGWF